MAKELTEKYYKINGDDVVEATIDDSGTTTLEPTVYYLDNTSDMTDYFDDMDLHWGGPVKRPAKPPTY